MKSSNLIITIVIAVIGFAVLSFLFPSLPAGLAFALGAIATGFAHLFSQSSVKASPVPTASVETDDSASRTLYVGNLPYKANESDVKALFEAHGEVYAVRLMKDKRTGKRRGFGFVVIRSQDADAAISALNEADYLSRQLKVREANEPKHEQV